MILIITNTKDITADYVVREVKRRGLPFRRLNTDEFPIHARGTVQFEPGSAPTAEIRWDNRDWTLRWNDVTAIWYRRPIPPVIPDEISDPPVRKFAIDESYEFLRGLWLSTDAFWISHPESIRTAEHKINQLAVAQSVGFTIPRTTVTNEPEQVLRLRENCTNGIIVKPLYLGFIDDNENSKFIYTSEVTDKDLEKIGSVSITPSIFQECIPKTSDIRVTVVGGKVFSARINARNLPKGVPDWRCLDVENLDHEVHALPDNVAQMCIELVKALHLEFGAIDLALTKEGNYIFFEINPNGQWAWLERLLGSPISAAIVDHLVNNARQ